MVFCVNDCKETWEKHAIPEHFVSELIVLHVIYEENLFQDAIVCKINVVH